MTDRRVARVARLTAIIAAKLEHAERTLATVNREIHSTVALLELLKQRLAITPLTEQEWAYAALSAGWRGSLTGEVAMLEANIKVLLSDQGKARCEVGRLLRQEASLSALAERAEQELRRRQSRNS